MGLAIGGGAAAVALAAFLSISQNTVTVKVETCLQSKAKSIAV